MWSMIRCTFSLALLLGIICASPLPAQHVRQVSLAYLAQRADVIVQGKVVDVVHEPLPGFPNISTVKVTMEVQDMVRGPSATKNYTFREIVLGLRPKQGKKGYLPGQQLLLFLTSPSRYGLSSTVGIEKGRFHVHRDASDNLTVVNEEGNEGLFNSVEEAVTTTGRKLTAKQSRMVAARRGSAPMEDFMSLVKTLTLLPRIR